MAKFSSPADAILGLTKSVAADWTKQRKAEERDANAAAARTTRLIRSRRMTIREAAFRVMDDAYDKASAGGTLPVNPAKFTTPRGAPFYWRRVRTLWRAGISCKRCSLNTRNCTPAMIGTLSGIPGGILLSPIPG
jgi:hypothetical protein